MKLTAYNEMIRKATAKVQELNKLQSFEPEPSNPVMKPEHSEPLRNAVALGIRPSTDESGLNKTERAYLVHLRALQEPWMGVQCITLKLGHDCRLTPDFWALDAQGLRAIDTKGTKNGQPRIEEDAMIKLRLAARLFPFVRFVIAWKVAGTWEHREVKP